jgi:hypothetical protein
VTTLFDPIRKKAVAETPEEKVRQTLLHHMIGALAFPKGLIGVEKNLSKIVNGSSRRRADIIAFVKKGEQMVPLLLVECKSDKVDEKSYSQANGYNSFLAAPFLCLAHAGGIRTFWKEKGAIQSVPFLPPYAQLVKVFQ